MANVALFDTSTTSSYAELSGLNRQKLYVGAQVYRTAAQTAAQVLDSFQILINTNGAGDNGVLVETDGSVQASPAYSSAAGIFASDAWHTLEFLWDLSLASASVAVDTHSGTDAIGIITSHHQQSVDIGAGAATGSPGSGFYVGRVKIGTDVGLGDILDEDWSVGNFSHWTTTSGSPTIVSPPGVDPPAFVSTLDPTASPAAGRVLIAFDDGPLVAQPTWTVLDQGGVSQGATIPYDLVSGYDTSNGRQTLISQTETGTATVYLNDRTGLFDDRNSSSPFQGKLSGRQILLQLYNPVTATWHQQFRGLIDDYTYDIDNTAVDANGDPINASVQIEAVDIFDYLNGYGLTPGLDGITPPAGMEDGVYYAATSGTVDDRIIEILADVGLDPLMYHTATGNVKVIAVKYDPDESALTALRDAADAELPFIANLYVDRFGRFIFRGRYSRFDPDLVAAEAGSDWDFTRWKVGDSKAISGDSSRAQMRVLEYSRDRADLINAAIAYPQGIAAKDMPNQVFANTSSITSYGKHAAAPMSDLLTASGVTRVSGGATYTANNADDETALYAKLLVNNKKDPRVAITALQLKSLMGHDARASVTWDLITTADISHIVNVKAGYPGGTGFSGGATQDDYYIEGRSLTVRPANSSFDYVELDLEVSPAIWSMDTHNVFPPF